MHIPESTARPHRVRIPLVGIQDVWTMRVPLEPPPVRASRGEMHDFLLRWGRCGAPGCGISPDVTTRCMDFVCCAQGHWNWMTPAEDALASREHR